MNTPTPLPEQFLLRLQSILTPQRYTAVLQSFTTHLHTTFRINTLKTTAEAVLPLLHALTLNVAPINWLPNAYSIPTAQKSILTESELYQRGEIYIQNLSSMLPPIVLDPQPGEEILDLTAAPGSKTTQIACLMHNQGRIAAVEKSKPRFFKLKQNLATQGVTCCNLYLKDGASVWRACQNRFDRVLLDAPCSSEGRFNRDDPDSFHYWSTDKIKAMARTQWQLLYSAFQCVKPGGVLVYSTCTFAPEENEAQLARLMKRFEGAVAIEAVQLPIENIQAGLTAWQGKSYPADVQRAVRIVPNEWMGGFFICRIRRIA